MLTVRLSRKGAKNDKKFRIVVQEHTRAPKGKFVEILGHYDPQTTPHTFEINRERYDYWVQNGAQPSDTIKSLVDFEPEKHKNKKRKKTKKQKAAEAEAAEKAAEGGEEAKEEEKKEDAEAAETKTDDAGEDKKEEAAEEKAEEKTDDKPAEEEKKEDK